MKPEFSAVEAYLDEVSAHIGAVKGKRDVILELRTAILDRAEEIGEGEITDQSVEKAMSAMGDAAEVALAFSEGSYIVGPRMYRPFLVYTGLLFAIHLVMIVIATVTEAKMELFPISILRVAQPHSWLNLMFAAVQALLTDIGLMVLIFAGIGRARRTVGLPRIAFRVEATTRLSLTRAVLTLLVMLILNVFRDDLFIVVVEGRIYPMFSNAFVECLPWINALLALIIARETAYGLFGEKKLIVAADGVLSTCGVVLMVWLLDRPPFFALPSQISEGSPSIPTLNQLMMKGVQLMLIFFAVAFALAAVKRFVRLRQLW